VGYPRPANLAYIRIAPSVQGRSREASRWAGRGAAPARTCTQHELPGGAGASSGATRSPRQELADIPAGDSRRCRRRKAGPV